MEHSHHRLASSSETVSLLLTPVFGKTGQKDKKEQPMREQGNRSIEERGGWSTELTDGLRNATLSIGWWVKLIGRWSTGRTTDGKRRRRESRKNTPKGNTRRRRVNL
jgi:hypothetical protein